MENVMVVLVLMGFVIIICLSALIWLVESNYNTNKKILSALEWKNRRDERLDIAKNPVARHRGGTGDH